MLLQEGNNYNIPVPTYYVESDSAIASEVPSTAPAGTIVLVNATNNFHVFMKQVDGTMNPL